MDPRKQKKIKLSPRQRTRMRMVAIAGFSLGFITVVLIIYFQFFRNEVTKAKSVNYLTEEGLPVDFQIEQQITINNDTLSRDGVRYKIAKPLDKSSQTAR